MAAYQGSVCVLTVGGINAKTVGNTNVGVTEDGTQRFIPLWCLLENTSATAITVTATVNIGTNSPNYDNIVTGGAGYLGLNQVASIIPLSHPNTVAANTAIVCRIANGATATTNIIRVDVGGYYV